MNAREAEKLLGGHAAGILTEAEKQILFSAALEHQELFNALADEEALRELLADPESRKQLLALLSEPATKAPMPLWRRPATLGWAASLLAMMTTSLVLWQRENPLPTSAKDAEKQEEAKPATEAPSRMDPSKGKALARPGVPEKPAPSTPAKGDVAFQAAAAPRILPAADAPLAAPDLARKPEAAPEPPSERTKQLADRPQASAVVEVVVNPAAADKTERSTAVSKESLESLPAHRALAGAAALSPGLSTGNLQPLGKASAKKDRGGSVPAPAHVLERLEKGALRLTVTWTSEHHLYLLKRAATGATVLLPLGTVSASKSQRRSVFEFSLSAGEHVDLFLLPQASPNPKLLPAEGSCEGYRERVI